jgi:hypothetical protein
VPSSLDSSAQEEQGLESPDLLETGHISSTVEGLELPDTLETGQISGIIDGLEPPEKLETRHISSIVESLESPSTFETGHSDNNAELSTTSTKNTLSLHPDYFEDSDDVAENGIDFGFCDLFSPTAPPQEGKDAIFSQEHEGRFEQRTMFAEPVTLMFL